MTFSQQLREANDDLFQAIFEHPFVRGLGEGVVPKAALTHYVKADYEYLTAFLRIYGAAVFQSETREQAAFFNEQIDFVLNSEIHPHNNFCDIIGVDYDQLQGFPLPPTADHYVKHMMCHAHNGFMGETICALLPCPWTYKEIGEHLMSAYQPDESHPFYPWISFYADSMVGELTDKMCGLVDAQADGASVPMQVRMKDAFRKSCQLEWAFWEMAYSGEQWPGPALKRPASEEFA